MGLKTQNSTSRQPKLAACA